MDQGKERAVVYFVMDAVAGARPGLLGGIKLEAYHLSRQPLFFSLSVARGVLGLRFAPPETSRRQFSRAVAAAVFLVHVAAATSASCRGTSQQNIPLQMFLQLQTLRRHVSRPVAAGVSLSLKEVAAS